jgi:hypothetical protein
MGSLLGLLDTVRLTASNEIIGVLTPLPCLDLTGSSNAVFVLALSLVSGNVGGE